MKGARNLPPSPLPRTGGGTVLLFALRTVAVIAPSAYRGGVGGEVNNQSYIANQTGDINCQKYKVR